ncbi:MAG TPA: amidohydrolase family protein, partial [Longimicrobiales bacterium]|nr:amidohydrolase family protein [Longimicrobiales bacterium]
AILIEGNRIVEVGRASEVEIPPGYKVIDTSGRTMMPGLIDAHAHLMDVGHGNYARWFPWAFEEYGIERVMEVSAKQFIMAGVTSVIDLCGPLEESISIRDRINDLEIPGPRAFVSGPWITRRGGSYPPQVPQIVISSTQEAVEAVDFLAEAGVDVIKAYPMTPEDYQAVVRRAHEHRIRVHAHVYSPESVWDAFNAGVDVLTHVGSAGRPAYSKELVDAIVVDGRPVVPTGMHRVWLYPATIDFPERLQDPKMKQQFPPDLYEEIAGSFEHFETLPYFRTTSRQMFFGEESLTQWITSGAVVGIGTDSGTPMNFNWDGIWREMKIFVDHGMSPQRTIEAATWINARLLGRGSDLGTIEEGKLADIIVVEGNPLFDLTKSLSHVEVVIKDGVIYKGDPDFPQDELWTW